MNISTCEYANLLSFRSPPCFYHFLLFFPFKKLLLLTTFSSLYRFTFRPANAPVYPVRKHLELLAGHSWKRKRPMEPGWPAKRRRVMTLDVADVIMPDVADVVTDAPCPLAYPSRPSSMGRTTWAARRKRGASLFPSELRL